MCKTYLDNARYFLHLCESCQALTPGCGPSCFNPWKDVVLPGIAVIVCWNWLARGLGMKCTFLVKTFYYYSFLLVCFKKTEVFLGRMQRNTLIGVMNHDEEFLFLRLLYEFSISCNSLPQSHFRRPSWLFSISKNARGAYVGGTNGVKWIIAGGFWIIWADIGYAAFVGDVPIVLVSTKILWVEPDSCSWKMLKSDWHWQWTWKCDLYKCYAVKYSASGSKCFNFLTWLQYHPNEPICWVFGIKNIPLLSPENTRWIYLQSNGTCYSTSMVAIRALVLPTTKTMWCVGRSLTFSQDWFWQVIFCCFFVVQQRVCCAQPKSI